MNLITSLIQKSKEYERMFGAFVLTYPDITIRTCAWLNGNDFFNKEIGLFWEDVKSGVDPVDAALSRGVSIDVTEWVGRISSSATPDVFAEKIAEAGYMTKVAGGLSELAKSINAIDIQGVRQMIEDMSQIPYEFSVVGLDASVLVSDFNKMLVDKKSSISTGLYDIDKRLGGLFRKELTILASRPGMGKTSLAINMAKGAAKAGFRTLFVSLEMSKEQLWARMACGMAGLEWVNLRGSQYIDPQHKIMLDNANASLITDLGGNFLVYDQAFTIAEILGVCAASKPDLVIIDHLGEIFWHEDDAKEVQWYGRAAKIIRTQIAKRMDCHVILIHQLNRGVEGRSEKRPLLSDLRQSGELEQIADIVMMLYREDYYSQVANPTPCRYVPVEVWIRKFRQGASNTCDTLMYDLQSQVYVPSQSIILSSFP